MLDDERQALAEGLRSSDAFVLRRCQIILASARGKRASEIARDVGCDADTALNAIHAFNRKGVGALNKGSTRPHSIETAFDAQGLERLREILHQSPSTFGKPATQWTLALVAEVSFEQGLTARLVTGETVRLALKRLGISWKRAKHWNSSPNPEHGQERVAGTGG